MAGEWIRFGVCAFFVTAGLFAAISATVGVWRFKDPLCKMHAAAITDTLAFSMFLIGAAVAYGFGWETLKMAMAIVFLWMTSPVNSHLLSRIEYMNRQRNGTEALKLPKEEAETRRDGK